MNMHIDLSFQVMNSGKPALLNAWEIILISTSRRNKAFENKGSFNSGVQLCASVRLWRWSIAECAGLWKSQRFYVMQQ